jgi:5'(3')-deoxyribonucleotidase
MQKVIAIDCDEVLADTCNHALLYSNGLFYDKPLVRHQITDFLWHKIPGYEVSGEQFNEYRRVLFTDPTRVESIPLIEHAQRWITTLKEMWYRLIIVTGRHDTCKTATYHRLDQYFPGQFDDVVFGFHSHEHHLWKNKADLMRYIWSEILIDDGLHNCENVADAGMQAYLFDAPWNQIDVLHYRIMRTPWWKECVEYF